MSKTALNKTLGDLMMEPSVESSQDKINVTVRARYGSPDIPFLLAATRWAKPRGALGFALHARFAFQPESFELRRHVFKSIRITGIMNFAALSQDSRLWPSNSAPFMLLVARNELPGNGDSFYFISPKYESQLSATGQFRIDPCAATPISLAAVQEDPFAIRAIYKGGILGVDLLRRIRSGRVIPVREFLSRHYNTELSNGYQLGKPEKRTREAKHLIGLPVVTTDMSPFGVSEQNGELFRYPFAEWPRDSGIFKSPLLLLRASPKRDRHLRGALFYETDVAYTNAFFGLSLAERPELRPVANLLHVLSYSDLLLYFQLLTSPKFGVERKSSLQADFEDFPLVNPESMSISQVAAIRGLSDRLRKGDPCWKQVDELVSELYGLTSWDCQLIRDTLEFELPFLDNAQRASMPTTVEYRSAFRNTFNILVKPFAEDNAPPTRIADVNSVVIEGWRHVHIGRTAERDLGAATILEKDSRQLAALAESYWASRLNVRLSDGSAVVGYLDQRRYWSKTQARLLALEWLQGDVSLSETV